jgi:2'-5' RNA ligase
VRLFVAVWPPREVVASLRELPRPAVPGLRWTTEDQWHVTLRFLGDAGPAEAAAALDGLQFAARPMAVLGSSVERLGGSVLQVPVGGLDDLAAAVARATGSVGLPAPARPFRGHLTLARANRGRVPRVPVRDVGLAGRWEVGEVTLVASRLHSEGARYSVVGRWALPFP